MVMILIFVEKFCVSGSTLGDKNALDLSRQAESCNAQCGKILKGTVNVFLLLLFFFFFFKWSWEFKTSETIP